MKVLIIGGGASGMMAALSARKEGAEVCILERQARVGRKLLATVGPLMPKSVNWISPAFSARILPYHFHRKGTTDGAFESPASSQS